MSLRGDKLNKKISIFLIIGIILLFSYNFFIHQASEAFTIDATHEMTESAAQSLLSTEQKYGFRLVNISDKKVKLLRIQLVDYQGIMISDLRIEGKPFTAQFIPSHRVYSSSSTKSCSTNSQGIDVEYVAEIMKPAIKNPENVLITYSYMGLNHEQKIKIPIIRRS